MNWDAVGAIGEIVGALAVLITLIYLALQIRQNTKAQTIATYEAAMSGFNEIDAPVASDAEMASIWRRAFEDPSGLDEDERVRFDFSARMYANHLYKLFRLYEQGVFPESEWSNAVSEAKQFFSAPILRDFRNNNIYFQDLWDEMESRPSREVSWLDREVFRHAE